MGGRVGDDSMAVGVGRSIARIGPTMGFLTWAISLVLPAWLEDGGAGLGRPETWSGLQALYWSLSFAQPAFMANPLFLLALVAGWRKVPAAAVGLAAAAAVCAIGGIAVFLGERDPVWHPLVGVHVWIASMALVATAATLRIGLASGAPGVSTEASE